MEVCRIILKIILMPIAGGLFLAHLFFKFVTAISGFILGLLAVVIFVIALASLIILHNSFWEFLKYVIFAYVISPYGLPLLADWLSDKLLDLSLAIRYM